MLSQAIHGHSFLAMMFFVLAINCPTEAQEPDALMPIATEPRDWLDVSGKFKITASLVKFDDLEVQLRKAGGEALTVQKRRLSDNDKEYLEAVSHLPLSNACVRKVDEVLNDLVTLLARIEDEVGSGDRDIQAQRINQSPYVNFQTTPSETRHRRAMDDAAEKLVALHTSDQNAVAGVIAGTLMALGKDLRSGAVGTSTPVISDEKRLKEADKYLADGCERLRALWRHFPKTHPISLVSALNNRALLALKLGHKGRAATLLLEAATVCDVQEPVLIHNLSVLSALAENKNPIFSASTSQRKQMAEVLSSINDKVTSPKLPHLFLYTTNLKTFQFINTSYRASDLSTLNLWPEVTCFVCSGNGFLDCAGCVKGKASFVNREPIGVNPLNGEIIIGNKVRPKQCQLCRSVGFFKCTQCNQGQISAR